MATGGIGWRIEKAKSGYPISLPSLSADEESVLSSLSLRYAEWSKAHECENAEAAREGIKKLLSSLLEEEGLEADGEQKEYLENIAFSHLWGFSILDQLLADPQIEEIACIGIGKPVYVYIRAAGWKRTNGYFTSLDYFSHLVNKIARPLGRRLTSQTPRINALLPDGSRLHASIPPISQGEITIRKFTAKPMGIGELISRKSGNENLFAFLWLAVQSDSSILIAGNTSSGKTTFLGALASFIPRSERMLLIEETPELRLAHPHRITLVSNDELSIGMDELVRDSLRMRPDRVIVGEVRSKGECAAWMESVLSGQARGSYGTFHAQSAIEAMRRLRSLGIDETDLSSLDYIIVQRRLAKYDSKKRKQEEIRRTMGIWEVDKQNPMRLHPLFEFSHKKDAALATKNLRAHLPMLASRLGLSLPELSRELAMRAKFLRKLSDGKNDSETEFEKLQKFAYG